MILRINYLPNIGKKLDSGRDDLLEGEYVQRQILSSNSSRFPEGRNPWQSCPLVIIAMWMENGYIRPSIFNSSE